MGAKFKLGDLVEFDMGEGPIIGVLDFVIVTDCGDDGDEYEFDGLSDWAADITFEVIDG